ncbi:hypothetical protein [Pseudomonas tolaasii]
MLMLMLMLMLIGAPDVRYEQREVLGFTDQDLDLIRDSLLAHLTL